MINLVDGQPIESSSLARSGRGVGIPDIASLIRATLATLAANDPGARAAKPRVAGMTSYFVVPAERSESRDRSHSPENAGRRHGH